MFIFLFSCLSTYVVYPLLMLINPLSSYLLVQLFPVLFSVVFRSIFTQVYCVCYVMSFAVFLLSLHLLFQLIQLLFLLWAAKQNFNRFVIGLYTSGSSSKLRTLILSLSGLLNLWLIQLSDCN